MYLRLCTAWNLVWPQRFLLTTPVYCEGRESVLLHADCEDRKDHEDFNSFCFVMPISAAFMATALPHDSCFALAPPASPILQHPMYVPVWVTCHKFLEPTQ